MQTSTELQTAFERYLSGTHSEQDRLLLQEHFKKDATSEELLQLIRKELEHSTAHSDSDAVESILGRTDFFIKDFVAGKNSRKQQQPFKIGFKGIAMAVASVIAICVAILYYQFQSGDYMVRVEVHLGEKKEITLPDNSRIWVNAGSKISYPQTFDDKQRVVTVEEGQIYFDVVHEKQRPFILDR